MVDLQSHGTDECAKACGPPAVTRAFSTRTPERDVRDDTKYERYHFKQGKLAVVCSAPPRVTDR